MRIKLLFKKRIHGRVQAKWKPRGLIYSKPAVNIETTGAPDKIFQARSAQRKRFLGCRIKDIF
jgi:hypothetical protein